VQGVARKARGNSVLWVWLVALNWCGDCFVCRYVVKELVGQGTFGQVARCYTIETNTNVAVKIIKNQLAYYTQAKVEIGILHVVWLLLWTLFISWMLVKCWSLFWHRILRIQYCQSFPIDIWPGQWNNRGDAKESFLHRSLPLWFFVTKDFNHSLKQLVIPLIVMLPSKFCFWVSSVIS